MDWASMFEPSLPVLELVARGSVIFLGLTLLLRITGQREAGAFSVTDLLVVVLIASAVAHGFAPESGSITDGAIVVVTILCWSVFIDAVCYRFPRVRPVFKATKRPLIVDGRLDRRQLRREFLSREEVEAELRLQGIESIDEVSRAYLEPNGMVSAFRKDGDRVKPTPAPPAYE